MRFHRPHFYLTCFVKPYKLVQYRKQNSVQLSISILKKMFGVTNFCHNWNILKNKLNHILLFMNYSTSIPTNYYYYNVLFMPIKKIIIVLRKQYLTRSFDKLEDVLIHTITLTDLAPYQYNIWNIYFST